MINLHSTLCLAGISERESEAYLALLKHGPITVSDLAKCTSNERTHMYSILRNLVRKGLASYIFRKGAREYHVTDPKNLLTSLETHHAQLTEILPHLEKMQSLPFTPVDARVLEGKKGLRALIKALFDAAPTDVLVFGATGKSHDVLKFDMPHVDRRTSEKGIKGRIITADSLRGEIFTTLPNFEVRYVPKHTDVSTMIFEDMVSINIFDEQPSIILIKSASMADSYRDYFGFLWNQASE